MSYTPTTLAAVEKKGRDLLVYHGGAFNWQFKRSRSAQGQEAYLIIHGISRARGCGVTKEAAMEAAAAKIVWTETENAVHSLGRLPAHRPAPRAKLDHLNMLCQRFHKSQLRWLPSLQVYRLKDKVGSNEADPWESSWVAVVAVSCDLGTFYHRGEAFDERSASYEAARAVLQWYASASTH